MSVKHTFLKLEPTWSQKGIKISGSPAVREKVQVTLVDALTEEGNIPEGLVLRVFGNVMMPCHTNPSVYHRDRRYDFARFPLNDGDEWQIEGDNLTCVMDFNTEPLIHQFRGLDPMACIEAYIGVESGSKDQLYALGRIRIRNWTINQGDPVPGSSALAQKVDGLETALAEHAHTGNDGSTQVNHDDLINAGSMTHSQLEQQIGSLENTCNDLNNEVLGHINAVNPHGITLAGLGGVTKAYVDGVLETHNESITAHDNLLDVELGGLTDRIAHLEDTFSEITDSGTANYLPTIDIDESTDYEMRQYVKQIGLILRGVMTNG